MPKLTQVQRKEFIGNIQKVAKNNNLQNPLIATISQSIEKSGKINRQLFIALPVEVEKELMAHWLREYVAPDIDKKTVERLTLALKTGVPNSRHPIRKGLELDLGPETAYFNNTV